MSIGHTARVTGTLLSDTEIDQVLIAHPGWERDGDGLRRLDRPLAGHVAVTAQRDDRPIASVGQQHPVGGGRQIDEHLDPGRADPQCDGVGI